MAVDTVVHVSPAPPSVLDRESSRGSLPVDVDRPADSEKRINKTHRGALARARGTTKVENLVEYSAQA